MEAIFPILPRGILKKKGVSDNLFSINGASTLSDLIPNIYQNLDNVTVELPPALRHEIGENLVNPDGAIPVGPLSNHYQASELIWRFRGLLAFSFSSLARNPNYVQYLLSNLLGTVPSITRQFPLILQQLLIANQAQIPAGQTWAYGNGVITNLAPFPNISLPIDNRLQFTQSGHVGPIGYEAALLLAFQVAGVGFGEGYEELASLFHIIEAPSPQVNSGYFLRGCTLSPPSNVICYCQGDGGTSTSNSNGAGVYHAIRFRNEENYLVVAIHTMDARSIVCLRDTTVFQNPQYGRTSPADLLSNTNFYPAPFNTSNARFLAHLHVGVWTQEQANAVRTNQVAVVPDYAQIGSFYFYINPEMSNDDAREAYLSEPDVHDELFEIL